MRWLNSLKETFRTLGVRNGLWLIVHRVLGKVSKGRARVFRYYLVAQPIPQVGNGQLRATASSVVRRVEGDDPHVSDFPRPQHVIARRFDSGAHCYVAEVKGRFAGYLWLAYGGYDEDEVRCRFEFAEPAASVWDFDVYVVPEFRMGRTFVRLWQTANTELASQGVAWTFSRISAFNPMSMSSHQRMGMRSLFMATFLFIGPLQVAMMGVAPFVHIGWAPGHRPLLKLPLPEAA